ncbi:rod-binding protein [Poriferisphaera sp. WC338]|uniref:rod-binding protein n=1 Tax=Poriferisphaera sp. WC338 TaxID=3425129 RepID=UPI003D813977
MIDSLATNLSAFETASFNVDASAGLLGRDEAGDRHDFVKRLAAAQGGVTVADKEEDKQAELEQKVRQAAEQLVASAFVTPMLKQMRSDPFKTELFHGGRGEDIFMQQWDTQVADHMVKRQGFDMVDAVYNQIIQTIDTKQSGVDAESFARAGMKQEGIDLHA